MITRRALVAGLITAPAIVHFGNLMPVRQYWRWYFDGTNGFRVDGCVKFKFNLPLPPGLEDHIPPHCTHFTYYKSLGGTEIAMWEGAAIVKPVPSYERIHWTESLGSWGKTV